MAAAGVGYGEVYDTDGVRLGKAQWVHHQDDDRIWGGLRMTEGALPERGPIVLELLDPHEMNKLSEDNASINERLQAGEDYEAIADEMIAEAERSTGPRVGVVLVRVQLRGRLSDVALFEGDLSAP